MKKAMGFVGIAIVAVIAILVYFRWTDKTQHVAEPKSEVVTVFLENNQEIQDYDLTGDGEKDTICMWCEVTDEAWEEYGDVWKLILNGETIYTIEKDCVSPSVTLYQMTDHRVYLEIEECTPYNGDIYGFSLYEIAKGKLTKVLDLYEPIVSCITNFHYTVERENLTDSILTVKCSDQFMATGRLYWKIPYVYESGDWRMEDTVFDVCYEEWQETQQGWTTNQQLTVYTTTGMEEQAFVLERGEKVRIEKIALEHGNTYFLLVREDGKEGWIKNPEEYCDGYFKEVLFAG